VDRGAWFCRRPTKANPILAGRVWLSVCKPEVAAPLENSEGDPCCSQSRAYLNWGPCRQRREKLNEGVKFPLIKQAFLILQARSTLKLPRAELERFPNQAQPVFFGALKAGSAPR